MARADLLLQLAEASLASDPERARKIVAAISAEEREKKHKVLANDLEQILNRPQRNLTVARNDQAGAVEIEPKRRLHDLVLPDVVVSELSTLIEEQHRADLLRSFNLEPRHRVLLVGPPGNGKTSCAEAIATELSVPLVPLSYENVITSYLGETSSRIGRVMNFVQSRHCVLFLDEFDTLAKERGDEHESGEIKRVVSTLLLQLDRLPSYVVVCAATNHSELLDRAVWRRFQLRLQLPSPSRDQRVEFITSLSNRLGLRLTKSARTIVDRLGGNISLSEIEEFCLEVRRRQILDYDPSGENPSLVDNLLTAWSKRAQPLEPSTTA